MSRTQSIIRKAFFTENAGPETSLSDAREQKRVLRQRLTCAILVGLTSYDNFRGSPER
jgi:hypothetical protein